MILVATGTTGFDGLVRQMDRLAPSLGEKVVMQIGAGESVPRHAEHFRIAPSLASYIQAASLVVSHGGQGTCLEVLRAGRPLIAISNPDRYDHHQDDLLRALEADGHLLWCRDMAQLEQAIVRARTTRFRPYQPPECTIHLSVREYLLGLPGGSAGARA